MSLEDPFSQPVLVTFGFDHMSPDQQGLPARLLTSTTIHCAMQHAVALSVNLLRLAPALQPIWQKQPELLSRVQDLCSTLLASAEPQLRPYLEWPLPEPHPMAEDYQLARKLLSTMPALGQLLQRVPAGYSVGLGGAGELGGLLQKLRKVLPGA